MTFAFNFKSGQRGAIAAFNRVAPVARREVPMRLAFHGFAHGILPLGVRRQHRLDPEAIARSSMCPKPALSPYVLIRNTVPV